MLSRKTIISVQGKHNEKYSKCIFLKNMFFSEAALWPDLMKLAAAMFVVIE